MAKIMPSSTNPLDDLLSSNQVAKEYYMALPEHSQGMLKQHSNSIHSLEDLHRAAQKSDTHCASNQIPLSHKF